MELWCGKLGGVLHYDVVRNSTQTTPTHRALDFLGENPSVVQMIITISIWVAVSVHETRFC